MNVRHLASPRPRALAVFVAAFVVWASIAVAASAAPEKKTFTTSVGPNPLYAGRSYSAFPQPPIVYEIKNTSPSALLGSVNVTVPAGILASTVTLFGSGSATLVGTTIQMRNLNLAPNQTAQVLVYSQVECASNHAAYVWSTFAKQSNDFNGTGNDLKGSSPSSTVTGSCQVVYTKQPRHAEKSPVAITNAIYNPDGDPVTVTVVDAVGDQTVTWWSGTITLSKGDDPTGSAVLSGGIVGTVSGGSATFTPSINLSGTGYSLVATANPTAGSASVGTASAGLESNNFNIVDDATICTASSGCSSEAGNGQKTAAHVDASADGADGDLVILSINDPAFTVNCTGYNETSDVISFDVTDSTGAGPSNRSKIATLTLLATFVTKAASKYQVCYDNGAQQPLLLPNCSNQTPVPPCVLSKSIDHATGNLVIVISAPPGDPAVKF